MLMGRDLCGLPVFSLREGAYIGRVADYFVDGLSKSLDGIVLGRTFATKKMLYIPAAAIRRVYRDGVIVTTRDALERRRFIGGDAVSYQDFADDSGIVLAEGEIVSDIVFDDALFIRGYEISGGLWHDLVCGRGFRRRPFAPRRITK
ncbi:MAG: PRC-barrel domain-containing protein [Bacillota bacterium]